MKVFVKIANFSRLVVNLIEIHILKLKRNFSHKEMRSNINKLSKRKYNNSLKNLNRYSITFHKHTSEEKSYIMVLKIKVSHNLHK